jgi:hypothetical protein
MSGECPIVDVAAVPDYVNNRDRVTTTRALVDWLLSAGTRRIVILDNQSTYPPLLGYYKNLPAGVEVEFFNANCGPWAFWDKGLHLSQTTPYIVSDSDVVPAEGCPKDLIRVLNLLLHERPRKINFRAVAAEAGVSAAWLYSQEQLRVRIMGSRTTAGRAAPEISATSDRRRLSKQNIVTTLRLRIKNLEEKNRELTGLLELVYGELALAREQCARVESAS